MAYSMTANNVARDRVTANGTDDTTAAMEVKGMKTACDPWATQRQNGMETACDPWATQWENGMETAFDLRATQWENDMETACDPWAAQRQNGMGAERVCPEGQPYSADETAAVTGALNAIPVRELNYADWLQVGMALKDGGYPCSLWDDWSKNDVRYHPGECESKWATFKGGVNHVTVGTLFYLAGQRGWTRSGASGNHCTAADDGRLSRDTSTYPTVDIPQTVIPGEEGYASPSPTMAAGADRLSRDTSPYPAVDIPQTVIPDEEVYAWGDPTMCNYDTAPAEALIHYLELLFRPEERVNIVVNAYRDADGKWKPKGRGDSSRTAGELMESLKKHPGDVGATVGDWEPEAGAWIRINPVDGNGVKDENITAYRYALVEADSISMSAQMEKFLDLNLPIRALVTSGGRSLHALVPVNAPDGETYAKRVAFLYAYLEKNGYPVDPQNRNPARLSRMPGVTRGKRGQGMLNENMGPDTWEEWIARLEAQGVDTTPLQEGVAGAGATGLTDMSPLSTAGAREGGLRSSDMGGLREEQAAPLQGTPGLYAPLRPTVETGSAHPGLWADGLPPTECFGALKDTLPQLPEELIGGILRQGHKMLIAGPSKAGKSFLLLELAVSIAEGIPWLGFPCKRGKVFYINLEIDRASCFHRIDDIYRAMDLPMTHADNIDLLNLRGRAEPLDHLVPGIIGRVKDGGYAAVIIDPIYKVIMGDENNASDMGTFCNQFDRIADTTGASVIYCHHHSKGAQGAKKAMDRASGSGVFARDPDAQLDIVPLEMTEHIKNWVRDGADTPWRMEGTLREFATFKPVDFWFSHPLHRLDTEGALKDTHAEGSFEAAREKTKKWTTPETRLIELRNAYDICTIDPPVTVKAMADFLHITERSVRDRLKEFEGEFWYKGGYVGLNTPESIETAETPWEDTAVE